MRVQRNESVTGESHEQICLLLVTVSAYLLLREAVICTLGVRNTSMTPCMRSCPGVVDVHQSGMPGVQAGKRGIERGHMLATLRGGETMTITGLDGVSPFTHPYGKDCCCLALKDAWQFFKCTIGCGALLSVRLMHVHSLVQAE